MDVKFDTQNKSSSQAPLIAAPTALLQRKCDCGNHAIGGQCQSCREKKSEGTLQRAAIISPSVTTIPAAMPASFGTEHADNFCHVRSRAFGNPTSNFAPKSFSEAAPVRLSAPQTTIVPVGGGDGVETTQAATSTTPATAPTTAAATTGTTTPTTAPAAPSPTPATAKPPTTFCSACVDDLKIQNISKINSGNSYGHSFDLVADLQYKANTGTAHQDATLKWEEKTSRPPSWQTNITAGTWNDMFALYPASPTFNGWTQNRTKPCPGKETMTITDPPTADVTLPARTLEFRITVSSAAGAGCTTASKTVTAKQVLVPDGSGGITTQTFTTP